jgi:hypothetical protein
MIKQKLSILSQCQNHESELLYDWRFTANQFVLMTSPLRLTTSNFIFQLNTFDYSPYVTSSPRAWVCRLQLLLVLACAVILKPESHGNHDHILLSQIWDSHQPEGQVLIFISLRLRVAGYTPMHWVPFLLPLTTRLLFLFHFYAGKVGLTVSVMVLFIYKNEKSDVILGLVAWLTLRPCKRSQYVNPKRR